MLFVCIIMHTPPNASSNTVNNTVIFIGIPAFLIMARPFDISNKYDTIIVGSDQVWRPKYTGGIEKYFLSFADNRIKKIAYSASFGTDKNEYSFYE